MTTDLDRLVDLIARDAAPAMAPGVISRVYMAGTLGDVLDEPQRVASAVTAHPRYVDAVEAVAADVSLRRIAPQRDAAPVRIAAVDHSQGAPSSESLVAAMIGAASVELRCFGIAPSADALAGAALENLGRLRKLGRGDDATVTTFFGLSGLFLEPDQALELPWGKVTPAVGWYGLGEMVGPRPTSSVLAAQHRLEILIANSLDAHAADGVFERHSDWAQRIVRLVILAIVLGTSTEHVACVPTFEMTVLPYELPISTGGRMVLAPPLVERKLAANEGQEIERWARLLDERYTARLETAARRVIAAVSQRIDPADRLIDAVTAWESLFSANQDASLRITASLAWLLKPDDAPSRDALQDEARKIYNVRSDVVHGRTPKPVTVYNSSFRATELAVAALTVLLELRPELIPVESEERSRRLLLRLS